MKKLFMAIFIPVIFILGTPALIATIMYDGSGGDALPIHLYTEDADAQAMLMQELTDSFDELDSGATDDFEFNLSEDVINVAIFQAIREENPDYMPTADCDSPDACYIVAEQQEIEGFNIMLRVVGAWVEFDQDLFSLNVFLEVELEDGFTYKTVISTEFKFTDVPGKYVLEFEKISIGNLPIPSALISNVLSAIENNVDDFDLESLTADLDYGDVDLAEFSFTMLKSDIVDLIGEESNDETTEQRMMKQVLSEVFEQEIVTFEFIQDEFVASGRLSKFKSEDTTDIPEYLYDLHVTDPGTGEVGAYDPAAFDGESYLSNLFTEYIFNYALIGEGFEITEETFNKLIYSSQGGFEEMMFSEEIELTDGVVRDLEYGIRGMWFEIDEDAIYAKALIQIDSIESVLILKAEKIEAESTVTELVFEFSEITFGEDADESVSDYVSIDDLSIFKEVLADLGDVEFGIFDEFGTLTISAERLSQLMQDGSEEGTVNVTGISLIEGAIVIDIEPADPALAAALESFGDAIEDVIGDEQLLVDLEGVLDTTTEGPEQEVFNAVQDLQETLLAAEAPTPEQVDVLFENFAELDEETQQEFLETFEGLIDPTVFEDFEALFGEVTEETTP